MGRRDFKKRKTGNGAVQPITAAIWFRFAPPKFLLHCVPQKLHIAAVRCMQFVNYNEIIAAAEEKSKKRKERMAHEEKTSRHRGG